MTVYWTCKGCEEEIEVEVTAFVPAQTYGPPESCYPAEGGEISPEECPKCGKEIPTEDVHEKCDWREGPDDFRED